MGKNMIHRKMSEVQKVYLLAKAHFEVLEARENELYRQYILDQGIKNPDGATPEKIYAIEDDETFDRVNEATAKLIEESGLGAEIVEAREMLRQAEEGLIDWSMGVAMKDLPADAIETLQSSRKRLAIRQKLIELALKMAV